MSVKLRLTIMSFFQFFVWGAWLITIANYWFGTKHWDGTQFGAIFATMGIASLFMPTLMGIIADRWINAEKLYSILHFLYAATLFYLPTVNDPQMFFLHYATGHVFLHADVSTIQFHFLHRTYFGKLRLSKILPPDSRLGHHRLYCRHVACKPDGK